MAGQELSNWEISCVKMAYSGKFRDAIALLKTPEPYQAILAELGWPDTPNAKSKLRKLEQGMRLTGQKVPDARKTTPAAQQVQAMLDQGLRPPARLLSQVPIRERMDMLRLRVIKGGQA